jgi:NAD(P)-dependent dehydrogenase (short-subunit alcohol dehydrogenase family)
VAMVLKPGSVALIVGAGAGLSASIARKLAAAGVKVGLAARSADKLAPLADEIGALAFRCDASVPMEVERLFSEVNDRLGSVEIVVFNAGARLRGPIAEIDPAEVERVLLGNAFAGFLVGREAAKAMIPRCSGVIVFSGASASVKGFAGSAPFAMGKFALRGLAQSMARELGPKGIHVAHVLIDGGIRSSSNPNPSDEPDSRLDPDAIADSYLQLIAQPRSAWTQELDLRPWTERF